MTQQAQRACPAYGKAKAYSSAELLGDLDKEPGAPLLADNSFVSWLLRYGVVRTESRELGQHSSMLSSGAPLRVAGVAGFSNVSRWHATRPQFSIQIFRVVLIRTHKVRISVPLRFLAEEAPAYGVVGVTNLVLARAATPMLQSRGACQRGASDGQTCANSHNLFANRLRTTTLCKPTP